MCVGRGGGAMGSKRERERLIVKCKQDKSYKIQQL